MRQTKGTVERDETLARDGAACFGDVRETGVSEVGVAGFACLTRLKPMARLESCRRTHGQLIHTV